MSLTIGKLAKASEVGIDTLRYYERLRLLAPRNRTVSGYRVYDEEAVARVRFIKKAQGLGFSLRDIATLLRFGTAPAATAGDILALTRRKIAETEQKIAELVELKHVLERLADECPGEGASADACPILGHFNAGDLSHE